MLLSSFTRRQTKSNLQFDPNRIVDMGSGENSVLFLHGLFGTPEHWRCVMERLAENYRVVAPQLPIDPMPGRRESGINEIRDLSEYVAELIEHLGLGPLVLCGNSLGGLISIDLCAQHPSLAKGLILAGSAGLFERSPIGGSRPRPSRKFIRETVSGIVHRQELVTDELVDDWYTSAMDRDYIRFILRMSRATRDRTVEKELDLLNLPTMIVWGSEDQITPVSTAYEFRDRIQGSRLEFIDECGHAPNWECPEQFAELTAGFLPECFADSAK